MTASLMTPSQLAERWNIEVTTLSQWRWNGKGPPFLKLGKKVMYRLDDITTFEEASLYDSTVQYGDHF